MKTFSAILVAASVVSVAGCEFGPARKTQPAMTMARKNKEKRLTKDNFLKIKAGTSTYSDVILIIGKPNGASGYHKVWKEGDTVIRLWFDANEVVTEKVHENLDE